MKRIVILCVCILFLCSCGKKEMEFYCDEGILEGSRCKIVNSVEAQFTCQEGFNLNEETKKCENVISVDASYDIVCDEGFYLENGKCISENNLSYNNGICPGDIYNGMCKEIRYRYKAYHCLYGELNNETSKCDFVDERNPTEAICEEGYTYNKATKLCEVTSYKEAMEREVKR